MMATIFSSSQLNQRLPSFQYINWVQSTGSTNSDLVALARHTPIAQLPARPWLLGADHQNQGRGRSGRAWLNHRGQQLMFSCAFDVILPTRYLPTLSPLVGVVMVESLRQLMPAAQAKLLTLKWPNDLQWRQAKLAGLLTEVVKIKNSTPDHYIVVLGLGLNLRQSQALSQQLARPVADWLNVTAAIGQLPPIHPTDIISQVATAWQHLFNNLTINTFEHLPQRYHHVDGLLGQPLNILYRDTITHTGIGAGVNQHGQLLLQQDQYTQAISIGEVSVRPVAVGI